MTKPAKIGPALFATDGITLKIGRNIITRKPKEEVSSKVSPNRGRTSKRKRSRRK